MRVELGDDAGHAADHETEEEAADYHRDDCPDLLGQRGAADVTVAHSSHGGVGPVHGCDVPAAAGLQQHHASTAAVLRQCASYGMQQLAIT